MVSGINDCPVFGVDKNIFLWIGGVEVFKLNNKEVAANIIAAAAGKPFSDFVMPILPDESITSFLDKFEDVFLAFTLCHLPPGTDREAIGLIVDEMEIRYGREFALQIREDLSIIKVAVGIQCPVYVQ